MDARRSRPRRARPPVGGHRTLKDAATAALEEYVRRREQLRVLELEGTVDFDPSYDYKAERRRDNRRIPRDDGE